MIMNYYINALFYLFIMNIVIFMHEKNPLFYSCTIENYSQNCPKIVINKDIPDTVCTYPFLALNYYSALEWKYCISNSYKLTL